MSGRRLIGLAAIVLMAGLLATPARAQSGGAGGDGDYAPSGQIGGAAGVPGVNGGVGGDGGAPTWSCTCTGGGGGGGAVGAAGGAGGLGGFYSLPGGTGGGVGQDGTDGTGASLSDGQTTAYTASGGGGGGGAAVGLSGASLNNSATLTGGNGGKGGNGGVSGNVAGSGGGGGAGSTAFTITGTGIMSNSGTITGGAGGAGGAGAIGGNGGDAGNGIVVTATGVTINNSGVISGSAGGAGGAGISDPYTGGRAGTAGLGGAGIVGAGMTIINSGTIAGGTGRGAGGNAISFTGGANTLTSIGGTLSGNLGLADGVGASLTFAQTSADGASGDVTISGITGLTGGATDGSVAIKLDGGRSLTITGASSYNGGTSVSDGSTLIIGNSNSLGTGTVTMGETLAGVTKLVFAGDGLTIANTIVINSDPIVTVATGTTNTMSGPISGAGDIVLNGGGTLVLSGANTYTGGTTICGTACGATGGSSVLQIGVDTVGSPGAIVSSAIGTGMLTFDGGTLQAGGSYTIANAAQINATGATIDSNGYTFTYSGNIADAAGQTGSLLLKNANGTVILSGTNTYSGGTTVAGGTVRATNGSAFGTGTVTLQGARLQAGGTGDLSLANNFKIDQSTSGSTFDANGKTLTITGTIADGTGSGQLTISDSSYTHGQVVLLGTNTYTGGTTICSCVSLVLGDATHTTSIIGEISNNGSLYIRNADTSAITSLIANRYSYTEFSGTTTASAMTISNSGTLYFLDRSSAGNATITINSSSAMYNTFFGSVQFGTMGGTDTSTAGNATINNGGYIAFNAATNAGTATIINNFGSIAFMDQSSAAGATITNSNNAVIYFGGCCVNENVTAGNAVITNNDGGWTYFQGSATAGSAVITTNSGGQTIFYQNATGGDAQFITNGTGSVDFSGSRGTNGDGRITAGSIAGSGFYYIGGGNTLVVGGNNLSTTVSGVIADRDLGCGCSAAGPGNLEKAGTGTLALSGTNTYTGTSVVNGGMLQIDGSIASSSLTTVNAGGALSGAGTVGNTVIASGGILLAGNGTPGSSLTVAGNLAFQSGALYLVTIGANAATSVNATGTAALGGAIGVSIAAGSTVAKQYAVVSAAGGRSGTFTSLATTGVPAGLAASLSYDADHAYLNFALDYGTRTNLNTNQKTVAATLQNFFDANGGINAAFVGRSANGLTQLSGESATGSQQTTFGAMSQFMGLLTDPFVADRDGGAGGGAAAVPFADQARSGDARDAFASISREAPHPEPAFDQRWNVWAAGFGGSQTTSGNTVAGSNNTTSSLYGTAVGADYRFSPNTIAGFALAGGGTSFSVSGLGWGRSDLFQAGAFLRHNVGPAYLTAALAYGWQDVSTDRIVTLAGVDRLRAEFNANAWSGRVEGGYRFVAPWTGGLGLTPYVAGQFTTFNLPAYVESVVSGSNAFALAYTASSVTDPRSEIGLRTDKSFAMADGVLTLRGRAAWAHDFNPDRNVAATFQALPGASFIVSGARPAADSALTTASAEMKWLNGWSASASFEGEFSSVTRSYAGKGALRYAW